MTRSDWILIAVVAMVSSLLLGLRLLPVSGGQTQIRVELKGETIQIINLKNVEGSIITIPLQRGKARLEIKQGAIRLLPMPDSVCSSQNLFAYQLD